MSDAWTVGSSTILRAPHAGVLMAFWRDLLGWEVRVDAPDWAMLAAPGGDAGLSFWAVEDVDPSGGEPGDEVLLDVEVDDLEVGVTRAVMLGATVDHERSEDDLRVCRDPAGHPFNLWMRRTG